MKSLILLSLIFLQACGGGTTTGNPVQKKNVNIQMEDQQPFAWMKKLSDALIRPAYANVSSVKFCFKRLRFKPDSSTSGSNFDLEIGEVDINPSGTNLLTVSVPEGVYERIEFDLEEDCDGTVKPSVQFTNDLGPFSTTDHITIKFDGVYTVSADGTLVLNIDALFDAMDTVTNNGEVKTKLEATSGDF